MVTPGQGDLWQPTQQQNGMSQPLQECKSKGEGRFLHQQSRTASMQPACWQWTARSERKGRSPFPSALAAAHTVANMLAQHLCSFFVNENVLSFSLAPEVPNFVTQSSSAP